MARSSTPPISRSNYIGKVRQANLQTKNEIKQRHQRLKFKEENNKKYVKCESCPRWVLCHHPKKVYDDQEDYEGRRITDIVPLYTFSTSELLHCSLCFDKLYSEKYFGSHRIKNNKRR
jgi:hypothetical protein